MQQALHVIAVAALFLGNNTVHTYVNLKEVLWWFPKMDTYQSGVLMVA